MSKPDAIICWPSHMDYPIFRYNIAKYRSYFNEVFIVFTQDTMPLDLREWIMASFPDVKFVKTPPGNLGDWRNTATLDVLQNYSHADWVLFLEQDFLFRDERVFEVLCTPMTTSGAYVYREGDRWHPAFALVRRTDIELTQMNFGVQAQLYDHFGLFFQQLKGVTELHDLEDMELHSGVDFYHMAGLTNNYWVFELGQPFYRPEQFLTYNHLSLTVPVVQNGIFLEKMRAIEQKFPPAVLDEVVQRFFPVIEEKA